MRRLTAASVVFGILFAFGIATDALAQRAASAARSTAERERDRIPVPDYADEDVPPPRVELPTLEALPEAPRFELGKGFVARGFRIIGSTVFSDRELALAVAPFLDRPLYAESLPALTDALTELYIDAGYISSGAIVPDQTVENGILEIHIIEGVVGRLEIVDSGRLRRSWVEPRVRKGLEGPLRISKLDETLRLLQTDPRVERVDAALIPSATLGESIVRLQIEEANPWTMDLRVANDVAPSLGAYRAQATVIQRNVAGFGDTFYGTVSGARGLFDIELGYSIPFTPWLTEFEVFGDFADGDVVDGDFADSNFENEISGYGIGLIQPVWHTLEDEVRLRVELERRTSQLTFLEGLPLVLETTPGRDTRVRLLMLRLEADWIHRGVEDVFAIGLRTTIGVDAWNATYPNDTPFGRPTLPDAEFTAWLLQTQYARRIETPLGLGEIVARGDLQLASGSLFALEAFAMGGASTVRGYNENAVVTDNGALASLELRLPILPPNLRPHELRFAPFIDGGYAWDDSDKNEKSFDKLYLSVGAGLLYGYGERFEMKGYFGLPFYDTASPNDDRLQNLGIHLEATVSVF